MPNPFKVGDLVLRADARHALPQKLAEIDGNFCRVAGSSTFYHFRGYKRYAPPEEVIVIVTDGTKSKAYLKRDGKKVNEVTLKRNPADKHDLKMLTAFAVQRLLPKDDRELVARPAGYCGAVAVSGQNAGATLMLRPGLIMEFYGGRWKDAPVFSVLNNHPFDSFADLCKYMNDKGISIIELHRNT